MSDKLGKRDVFKLFSAALAILGATDDVTRALQLTLRINILAATKVHLLNLFTHHQVIKKDAWCHSIAQI